MVQVGKRLIILLAVCTFILVVGVIGYIGSKVGGWQERNAQAEADKTMTLPLNADGSATVQEGTNTFTFNKKVFTPPTVNGVPVITAPPPAPTPAPPIVVVVPPSTHPPSSTGKVYIFNLPQP